MGGGGKLAARTRREDAVRFLKEQEEDLKMRGFFYSRYLVACEGRGDKDQYGG